jgi:hypothetical protein
MLGIEALAAALLLSVLTRQAPGFRATHPSVNQRYVRIMLCQQTAALTSRRRAILTAAETQRATRQQATSSRQDLAILSIFGGNPTVCTVPVKKASTIMSWVTTSMR